MKAIQHQSSEHGAEAVSCDVAAFGSVRATTDELRPLRQQLTLPGSKPLPASFLKHVDDQTVAGLAAVFQAIDRFGIPAASFTDWGILAAPRFLGRSTMVSALQRFGEEGAWGVSPHLIPHRSLHSLSGTISQALQIHGPNYGVGGGPDCASEVFLAAAAWLGSGAMPGIWLILTGWQPEPMPGLPPSASTCHAAALALSHAEAGHQGLQLRLAPAAGPVGDDQRVGVESLADFLAASPMPTRAHWALDGGGRLELIQTGAGACAFPGTERRAG